jgi:hypothetical protein
MTQAQSRAADDESQGRLCPAFVREDDGGPKGNRELLKLGATALPAGLLPGIPDLSAWMKEHTTVQSAEREKFGSTLRERAK